MVRKISRKINLSFQLINNVFCRISIILILNDSVMPTITVRLLEYIRRKTNYSLVCLLLFACLPNLRNLITFERGIYHVVLLTRMRSYVAHLLSSHSLWLLELCLSSSTVDTWNLQIISVLLFGCISLISFWCHRAEILINLITSHLKLS